MADALPQLQNFCTARVKITSHPGVLKSETSTTLRWHPGTALASDSEKHQVSPRVQDDGCDYCGLLG